MKLVEIISSSNRGRKVVANTKTDESEINSWIKTNAALFTDFVKPIEHWISWREDHNDSIRIEFGSSRFYARVS